MKFLVPLNVDYVVSFEEMPRSKGRQKVWKIEVRSTKGKKCDFPPEETPNEFWIKKTSREILRDELIKFVPDFQPKNVQDRAGVKQNQDSVDRLVANLCKEIERKVKEYKESLTESKWKQLKYEEGLYDSVVAFLAELNNKGQSDMAKHIEIIQTREIEKSKKEGKNVEVSKEEIASNLLFIKSPPDVLKFFADKLELILQAHKMLFEDKTVTPFIHRFKEELIICIATLLSYWTGREPKWNLFIGPSRSFKSTHINYFQALNKIVTYEVDMMTTNALMSGAEEVESFLPLLDEKTQIMDEMGTMLSMRKDVVVKLLSEYTVAYKGWATKISGSAKTSESTRSRFNWLAGITNEKFQELYDLFRTIGSRFITYEFPVYSDRYYHDLIDTKNQATVRAKEKALKRMLGAYIYGMFRWLKDNPQSVDDSQVKSLLEEVSNFYTIFRDKEPPLWFRQMITDMAGTIAVMFNHRQITRDDVEILISSTFSCNKKVYIEVVKIAAVNTGGIESGEILEIMPTYNENHIKKTLAKLERDGLFVETSNGYEVRDEWRDVTSLIRKHLERTNQTNFYQFGRTSQAQGEYIPSRSDSDGGLLY
jgi:hypothetical protein